MIFPCPQYINCDKSDVPIAGLNSEAPDAPTYIAINFGQPYNLPRMDWTWFNATDSGQYLSLLSQEDANAQAQAIQTQNLVGCNTDVDGGCWTDQNGNQVPVYGNQQYTFPVTCPDGLVFEYTVPPGRYYALDPVTANQTAQSFAASLAYNNQVCLSALPSSVSFAIQAGLTITASGNYPPFTFSIVGGSLPPGMSAEQLSPTTFTILGAPTGLGSYTFTVMAVDTQGNFMVKTYTVTVNNNPFPWSSLVWGTPSEGGTPPSGVSFVGGTFEYTLPQSISAIMNTGTYTYTGPASLVTVTVTISNNTAFSPQCFAIVKIGLGTQAAPTQTLFNQTFGQATPNGTYVYTFVMPAGSNQPVFVYTDAAAYSFEGIQVAVTLQ